MTKVWKQQNESNGDDCLSGTLRVKQVGYFGLKCQAIQDRKQDPLLYAAFGFRYKNRDLIKWGRLGQLSHRMRYKNCVSVMLLRATPLCSGWFHAQAAERLSRYMQTHNIQKKKNPHLSPYSSLQRVRRLPECLLCQLLSLLPPCLE